MKLLSISCNQCGAPLEVPTDVKFVTCQFCESQLQVHRTENSAYTEVLEALEQKTNEIASDVAHLKLQSELQNLDRDWERKRKSFMVKGENGHLSIPSKTSSIVGAVVGVGFGIFWIAMVSSMGGGGFALFGVLFIGVSIFASGHAFSKADAFEKAKRRYRRKRLDLIERSHQ